MEKFKGTPGPWRTELDPTSNGYITIQMPDKTMATYYGEVVETGGKLSDKTMATAKVIECAPEMLGMLKFLLKSCDWEDWSTGDGEIVRRELVKLIQKATTI